MFPVDDIKPYEGWVLMRDDYSEWGRPDSDWYEAHHLHTGDKIILQVGRYSFRPTQERFEFLVRTGGSQNRVPCMFGVDNLLWVPWSNEAIDEAIAKEASCPDKKP